MKRLAIICTALLSLTAILGSTVSATGNEAPSGSHYNLNIIGVPEGAEENFADGPSLTGSNRHTIFVSLDGPSKILLQPGDFQVIDGNALDGTATFQLPNPLAEEGCTDILDAEGNVTDTVCVTAYSVYARAPGNSGGDATMKTCATDTSTDPDTIVCSVQVFEVKQSSKFQNVTKYLLFVFWDTDGDLIADRLVPIFDSALQGYYWEYDNNGLKLLQLRFYGCSTSVSLTGSLDSSDCVLTGN